MKTIHTLFCAFLFMANTLAQTNDVFQKKGKILIETGYNAIGGFGTGSGLSYFTDENSNLTSIGLELGKFISENFAIKFKGGILNLGQSGNLSTFAVGGKYYIGREWPVELGVGVLNSGDEFTLRGDFSFGYAAKLAPNIYLEPAVSFLVADGGVLYGFRVNFAMML
jgi:hypothetical protein